MFCRSTPRPGLRPTSSRRRSGRPKGSAASAGLMLSRRVLKRDAEAVPPSMLFFHTPQGICCCWQPNWALKGCASVRCSSEFTLTFTNPHQQPCSNHTANTMLQSGTAVQTLLVWKPPVDPLLETNQNEPLGRLTHWGSTWLAVCVTNPWGWCPACWWPVCFL